MKLYWKLFCSMVIVTVLSCSVGGYFLIDAQWRNSVEREAASLYEINDLLRYALHREMGAFPLSPEGLVEKAGKVEVTARGGTVPYRLSDSEGMHQGGKGSLPVQATPLVSQLGEDQRGWMLQRVGERTYLHTASALKLVGGTLYLENCRDISALFSNRAEQYRSFFTFMLALVVGVALVSLLVSYLLFRPLGRLSSATRRLAEGVLAERVRVDSDDELGRLSQDFNTMAARIEEQVQALTDAARRQEEFIGSFAHELKTPLTSIIGYADLLCSRPMAPEQVQESAGYIFREGRRLEALSQKMLELIILDRRDFPLREVSMPEFLALVGGTLSPALEEVGIHLTVQAEPGQVPLEPDLMEMVCLNLLDNARKAMEGGGELLLKGFVEGEGYCLQVRDTGKGIPPGELARVTEPFYMVDKSRARAQGGVGLGLALCQRIVALHGGSLALESIWGEGTIVTIQLKGGGTV